MTNAEARCNKSLRPRKPEGSLGRTALDSHTAPVYGLMPHPLLYLIAAGALQFQMCFPTEYFDRFFVYLLFVYLLLFMH